MAASRNCLTARYLPEHRDQRGTDGAFHSAGRPDVINKLGSRTGINQRFYVPKDWVTSDLALAAAKESHVRGANPKTSTWLFSARRPRTVSRRTRQSSCSTNSAQRMPAHLTPIVPAWPFRRRSPSRLDLSPQIGDEDRPSGRCGYDLQAQRPKRSGIFFWGDGAGAAVMEAGDRAGFIGAVFQADGTYAFGWGIAAGGTFVPASIDAVKGGRPRWAAKVVITPPRSMKIIGRAY